MEKSKFAARKLLMKLVKSLSFIVEDIKTEISSLLEI